MDATVQKFPVTLAADISAAVDRARHAGNQWATLPISARLKVLQEFRLRLVADPDALAIASAGPRSRPAAEAMAAELLPLAEACRFLERNAAKILRPREFGRSGKPLWLGRTRSRVERDPVGMVLLIGPGNYPLFLPGVQLLQALAAGNSVIFKPGRDGLAVASALLDRLVSAGMDPSLVVLTGEEIHSAETAIATAPDLVVFTGGREAGAAIARRLAESGTPAIMELSGCDAVIVCADADLKLCARALAYGLTLNAGATCMAPKRLLAENAIIGRLAKRLLKELTARAADFTAEIHDRSLIAAVDGALARSAKILHGAWNPGSDGKTREATFPLVLEDAPGAEKADGLMNLDAFHPLLTFRRIANEAEAVALVNDCSLRLGAAIFSRDEDHASHLASRLRTGLVTVNDLIVSSADPRLPFGGRGSSGHGVTRGSEGLLAMTHPKSITVTRGTFRPAYDVPAPGDLKMFRNYLRFSHAVGFKNRVYALLALLGALATRNRAEKHRKNDDSAP